MKHHVSAYPVDMSTALKNTKLLSYEVWIITYVNPYKMEHNIISPKSN